MTNYSKKLSISEICDINPSKSEIKQLEDSTLVTFLPMSNVSENGKISLAETKIIAEVKAGFTYFKEGDILFAKITPCMENGKGAMAKNLVNGVGFGSTEFHVLRPKNHIDGQWLYRITTSKLFRKLAESYMTGSAGQKRVPKQFFDTFKIEVPPIETQIKIAEALDKAQALIDKRKEQIEKMDEFVQSVFLDMFGDIFINSCNWENKKLGELLNSKSDIVDGPFGSSVNTKVDYVDDGEIPVIRTKNVAMFKFVKDDLKFMTREKYETVKRSQVLPGDIVLTKVGTIGNVCIFPNDYKEAVLSTTGSCRIRVNEHVINKIYLTNYLKFYKPIMLNIASTGVQAFLNMKHIKNFNVLLPPLELQNKFAQIVEKVEAQKELMEHSLTQMENNFNSIMAQAFRGELFN